MTQPILVNDVLSIVCEGMCEGRPWAMIRHYLVTAINDELALLNMLADHFENVVLTNMGAELTDKWSAECASIHRVAPQPMNVHFYPFTAAIVGSIATDGTPNDNALLLRLNTDETGPRNRGRVYVPGLPEASSNGGLLLGTKRTAWDTIAGDFVTVLTLGSESCTPVIFSRTAYGTDPPGHPALVADYTSQISSAEVVGNLASQRRRRYQRNVFG